MRIYSAPIYHSAILAIAGIVHVSSATAQNVTPAWADQLKAQYKIAKMAGDMNGVSVVQAGTVLSIQKAGVLGVPFTSVVMCPSRYRDGELHAPAGFCSGMVKSNSRFFQVGEQIYVLKVDVNVKKEQIGIYLVACDSCNGTDPPTNYKAQVVLEFAKGFLETATFAQVQGEISQVFAIPDSTAGGAPAPSIPGAAAATPGDGIGPPAGTIGKNAPEPVLAPVPAPQPPPDQPASTIEIGQSTEQIVAVLGQPQRIAKVGSKEIYFYKSMKITFNNGKVSDVE